MTYATRKNIINKFIKIFDKFISLYYSLLTGLLDTTGFFEKRFHFRALETAKDDFFGKNQRVVSANRGQSEKSLELYATRPTVA